MVEDFGEAKFLFEHQNPDYIKCKRDDGMIRKVVNVNEAKKFFSYNFKKSKDEVFDPYRTDRPPHNWYDLTQEFLRWLERKKDECRPEGPCGQSSSVLSGKSGLLNKYPTFEEAYEDFLEFRDRGKDEEE